jgi:putative transposase
VATDFEELGSSPERWAHLRFCIIGPLLAAPPEPGQLQQRLAELAENLWRHPGTGKRVKFGVSTLERWYYAAKNERRDPVGVLRRKRRADRGEHPAVPQAVREALLLQYREHPSWSYLLHAQNLAVHARRLGLPPPPSYPTLRRYMKGLGLLRQRRQRGSVLRQQDPPAQLVRREVRRYEVEYVSALWHLDFHHGSQKIVTASGEWVRPLVLAILDDHSRLVCHIQWYLTETAEDLVHGLSQALLKRGLPRALMTDNGSAMMAAETTEGLLRLGILHQPTLPYSPHQNGKQENLWAQVEGRLLAMLESHQDLTLSQLNLATQAWVEMEYHRTVHSETTQTPLDRFLKSPSSARAAPAPEELRLAFTTATTRRLRRGDGTISLAGRRFEVPARYHHFSRLNLRFASWDLSRVLLVDDSTGRVLCALFPLDKARNADARRRQIPLTPAPPSVPPTGMAPLLRQLIADYAATGLAPAYIPKSDNEDAPA